MKILYYSPHPQLSMHAPTGYGTHMREMIAAWRRMDIEVHTCIAGDLNDGQVGTSKSSQNSKATIVKKLIPNYLWQSLRDLSLMKFDKAQQRNLENQIESFQPDVIYERVAYLQDSGIKTAQKYGIRHVSEINAPYPEERVFFSGNSFFCQNRVKLNMKSSHILMEFRW